MNGKELYSKYEEVMNDDGLFVDPWASLGSKEKAAWNELASLLDEEMDEAIVSAEQNARSRALTGETDS